MIVARSSGCAAGAPVLELVVGDTACRPPDRSSTPPSSMVQTLSRSARSPRTSSTTATCSGLSTMQRDRAGVAEDPLDLLGRGGLVDRHGHRARGPDREVDQRPLVAGLATSARPGRRPRCPRPSGPWRQRCTSARKSRQVTSSQRSPARRLKTTFCGAWTALVDHDVAEVAGVGRSVPAGERCTRPRSLRSLRVAAGNWG